MGNLPSPSGGRGRAALFASEPARPESLAQKRHYDRVAGDYIRNLAMPHTEALGRVLLEAIDGAPPGYIGELCCGRGEAIRLLERRFNGRLDGGLGIDISPAMIRVARVASAEPSSHLPTPSTWAGTSQGLSLHRRSRAWS